MRNLLASLQALLRATLLAGGVLFGLAVAAGLLFYAKRRYDYYFGFSQQRWQAAGEALHGGKEGPLNNPRQHMLPDVLAHHLQPGMTRAQVLALLGPADSFGTGVSLPDSLASAAGLQNLKGLRAWSWHCSQSQPLLEYMAGWGFIDPVSLNICFSHDDRVSSYQVVEH